MKMKVLLLDPRWPTMVPVEILNKVSGKIIFTGEVPEPVRDILSGFIQVESEKIIVSTNELDSIVVKAIERGAHVFEVDSRRDPVGQARAVMSRALCRGAWEQAQSHSSLIPYLEEECAEVIQAIREGASDEELIGELGDVLLQVLFHAEIAARRGSFSFDDVAASFVKKMKKRQPYLFDGSVGVVPVAEQERLWVVGKMEEGGGD
ncbi:MazG nucleotide pyrophosphohydrolase domain-containing protein [Corynebacterium pseudotuberculosis]|uniref:MazG nucleotide pyrophosphohydrolase domain-containing protein n=1 Tax=Corynebacterium pseudotuberculosis TaxID=1719 RepID=UPI0002660FCA|nr:MazG nucleotide pyrophosphohydrolase domain-containing protein [Corynebacterium pseudotuberculosis]AFM07068.1 nucleotide pyrophosphohydrolase [Corynebacterium pseudotuberculosis Cp162]APG82047.1 MazG family transcriptional regulator [Corynebacterium pseudotuberculosis]WFP67858.1 MazG nucleotide pyrophosphohydrolase domain-containing protein [Corynebacterium pseudotuberculosis]